MQVIRKTLLSCALVALWAPLTFAVRADEVPVARVNTGGLGANETVDRIIVKYRAAANALRPGLAPRELASELSRAANAELEFVREMGTGAHVLNLPTTMLLSDARRIAADLSALAAIEYAEPDRRLYPDAVPNDPQYPNQWHLNDAFGGINAPAAWDITTGSASSVVAVIDSGSTQHPDLIAKWLPGYDFVTIAARGNDGDARDADPSDPGDWISDTDLKTTQFISCTKEDSSWHGTMVAGIIGATTQNASGVAGVDWAARLVPARVLGKCGASLSDVADAMLWSAGLTVPGVPANANPAKVLNASLGSEGGCSLTEQNAVSQVIAAGKIIVASAGNSNSGAEHSPSACTGVIGVAATARNGAKASYSNYGPNIALAAPGGDSGNLIITTGNDGTTVPGNSVIAAAAGTSFSAPVVSGVVSLMAAVRPSLDAATARQILTATARPFPDTSCTTTTCGAGIVDAAAAVRAARDMSLGVTTMVAFGDTDVGSPATLPLKLTNLGTAPLSIPSLFVFSSPDFQQAGTDCGILAAAASCTVSLRFNPTSTGLKTGDVQFNGGDGRTYRVSLAGYGYAAARKLELKAGDSGSPQYIAKGTDGAYWYTNHNANRVTRMSPSGRYREFNVPTALADAFDIAAGPDGNMWFTEFDQNKVARITPTGDVTEFVLPGAGSQPRAITAGPDGNLWFTEVTGRKIGRITPAGTIAEYTIPWANAQPRGITRGPDGNLWFTDSATGSVGRISVAGTFTQYVMPWTSTGARGITAGPDGNLWFAGGVDNYVGRVTPSGVFTKFVVPSDGEQPLAIVAGPDNAVWYTATSAGRVGRVDVATGQVSEFRLPRAGSSPTGIVVGPNNVMWIANDSTGINSIVALSIAGVSGANDFSDLWWGGTAENGWGMTIQQHGNTQFNVFFVYDGSGKPIWYAMPGGSWNADYTVFSGGLAKPTSAPLNNYSPAQFAAGSQVGTMAITFTGPSTATLNYTIDGIAAQKSIQRQDFGTADTAAGLSVGDMWWGGNAQNGWGVSITQQYRTLFAAWYTYDSNGNVTWYTLPGGSWSGNTYSGTLATATSSPWLGGAYNPASFTPAAMGTVSFNFSDANNAVMSYTFTAGPFSGTTQTKTLTRQPY